MKKITLSLIVLMLACFVGRSQSYMVDQTGVFAPIDISATGTSVALGDDAVSVDLPIGFSFDFFGNTYTNFRISSNGFIGFGGLADNGCCSGEFLPDAAAFEPSNMICFAWEDLDPANGGQPAQNVVRYQTVGVAPNRILVVEFFNVDHWPAGNQVSAHTQLYEGSNLIEIHTTAMPSDGGNHTQGIENIDSTEAAVVPGRNAANWSAFNDYVAFIPLAPPIINCPMDVMANTEPGVCTAQVTFADAVAIDPNGGTVTVMQTMGPPSGSDFPLGDTIVEFTATNDDAPNETTTCQFTVTVIDNQPPVVTCPADIVVDNDPGICGAVVNYPDPTVVDNCFNSGGMTTTGEVMLNNPVGTFTGNVRGYTFVAPVDFKMTSLRVPTTASPGQQSIQVMRFAAPVATFPATSSYSELLFHTGLDADDGYIPVDIDFFAGDIIGILGYRGDPGTNSYADDATIDIDGNIINITRFGTQNPITAGPAPQGTYWVEPSFANKSEVNFEYEIGTPPQPVPYTVVTGFPSGGVFPVGTTLTTLEYTDPGGNAVQCTFNVTVNDIEPPTVSCIGQPGTATGTATSTPGVAIPDNDPVGVATVLNVAADQTITDLDVDLDITHTWVGDLIVTLESPDGTVVTLIDRMGTPPGTFGCSENDLQVTLDDEAVDPIEDECSGSPITGSYTPNEALSAFDGESTMGDWILTVSDNAGGDTGTLNEFTLTYSYDDPGTPVDIVLDANGMASIAATSLVTGFDDNCGPGNVMITGGTGGVYDETINIVNPALMGTNLFSFLGTPTGASGDGTLEVMTFGDIDGTGANEEAWTITDEDTNTTGMIGATGSFADQCNTTLTESFVIPAALLDTWAADGQIDFTGTDVAGNINTVLCGGDFLQLRLTYPTGGTPMIDFTCDDLGITFVDITATDAAGNTATCTATVNVIDNTPPVLVCADVTIELGPTGMTDIEPEDLLASVPSTYQVVTISSDNQSGAEGFTDLTVPVTAAEVVSFDWDYTTPDGPAFDSFGYLLNGVYTELTDPNGALQQSGNSGPINVAPGDVFGFRSQSLDGLFGAATTTVSNFVPGFNGQFDPANWAVTLTNSDGDAFFVEIPGGPLSFDACGITVLAVDITEVTCDDIANSPLTATVFASDASGNLAACQSMITVVDALGPEVTCPADQTVDPGPGNLFYTVPDYWANGDATAVDNCTDPLTIFTQDPAAGTELSDGVYTVTICSTDEYGNEGCCTFELTVESILGAADNELSSAISLYPNPASEQVTLANGSNILLDNAMIFDVNGKLVNTIDLRTMGSEMVIDVSSLASGVYMVQITGEQSITVKRLIKE